MFLAYHQSYGSGITRPLHNKKEGGIGPEETEEQVIEAAQRVNSVEELLIDQEHPGRVCVNR